MGLVFGWGTQAAPRRVQDAPIRPKRSARPAFPWLLTTQSADAPVMSGAYASILAPRGRAICSPRRGAAADNGEVGPDYTGCAMISRRESAHTADV